MKIPDGWVQISKLERLGNVFNGLSGKTKIDFGEGEPYIPYVNVFTNAKVDITELDYVNIRFGEHQNKLNYGDIIFTTSSETIEEVGMTSVFLDKKGTYYLNSFCFIYRPKDLTWIVPEFAQYLFRSDKIRYAISLLGQGSTRYNLSKTRLLKEIAFNIPKELTEQTQIASILSKVDTAISQTEHLIAKYNRIKTGLMQDLLTKGIDKHAVFKTSKLKNIQINTDFIQTTFRTITNVRQGYQIEISQRKKEEGENRYIYITVQYLNNPSKYLEYIENPPEGVICSQDDVLFTRTGSTGQIVTNTNGVFHNNFFKITFNKAIITKDYLINYLNWKPVQDLIKELASTTTIPDMKHRDFYSMPIFFPKTIDEQNKITKTVKRIDATINIYKKELSKLQSIKTGLMQDLLSGKVRVNHLIAAENH